jgi:hypothetical protein
MGWMTQAPTQKISHDMQEMGVCAAEGWFGRRVELLACTLQLFRIPLLTSVQLLFHSPLLCTQFALKFGSAAWSDSLSSFSGGSWYTMLLARLRRGLMVVVVILSCGVEGWRSRLMMMDDSLAVGEMRSQPNSTMCVVWDMCRAVSDCESVRVVW